MFSEAISMVRDLMEMDGVEIPSTEELVSYCALVGPEYGFDGDIQKQFVRHAQSEIVHSMKAGVSLL